MGAATVPETVTVPAELFIDALGTIEHFQERVLVLNGRQETPQDEEIGRLLGELVRRVFGPISYWDEDGSTTHPIWQAIEDRSRDLTAEWVARIAENAPVAEAVA